MAESEGLRNRPSTEFVKHGIKALSGGFDVLAAPRTCFNELNMVFVYVTFLIEADAPLPLEGSERLRGIPVLFVSSLAVGCWSCISLVVLKTMGGTFLLRSPSRVLPVRL